MRLWAIIGGDRVRSIVRVVRRRRHYYKGVCVCVGNQAFIQWRLQDYG